MPIPAKNLVQHQNNIVTVALDTKLTEALALMIEHDFSQLPVVDVTFKPLGIVTTDGITRALLTLGTSVKELKVKDVFTKPPIFQADEDLLYLLDYLLNASAVFIVNKEGKLIGIITDYDTTQYFRQRAEDIVLVEDIESTLKSHLRTVHDALVEDSKELRTGIASLNTTLDETRKKSHAALNEFGKNKGATFTSEDVHAIVDRFFPITDKVRHFDSLTLSEYIQFAHKAWSKLDPAFELSKSAWLEMMGAVREIRNKLVHFRGDISPVERAKLRYCADWYKSHQPFQKDATPIDNISAESTPAESTPAESTPAESTPAESTPAESTPAKSAPAKSAPAESAPAESAPAEKAPVKRAPAKKATTADAKNKPALSSGQIFVRPANHDELQKLGYALIAIRLNDINKELPPPADNYNVSLKAIERLLNTSLPTAAFEHITWWTEDKARTKSWAEYGWVVTALKTESTDTFVKFKQLSNPTSNPSAS